MKNKIDSVVDIESFEIELPFFIELGIRKKKRYYLNLNVYRNLAFNVNNSLKKKFKEVVIKKLPKNVYFEKYSLVYTIYLPDKMHRDISNVGSVVDKFFADTLVASKIVEDDSYLFLQEIVYKFGGICSGDEEGRVIVKVINKS